MFPWPSIAASALAAAWLSVHGLAGGGFSVVVVAIGTALVVGIPIARTIQLAPPTEMVASWSRGVRMLAAVSVLGGVLASLPLAGPLRAMIAASLWMVASVVGPRPWAALGAMCMVLIAALGVVGLGHWTLLEPYWDLSGAGIAPGVVMGLLLAGAGGAAWTEVPKRAHPSLGIGLGGLALVAVALLLGREWEVGGALGGVAALTLTLGGVLGATDGIEHRRLALPGAVLASSLALVPPQAAMAAVGALLPVALAALLGAIVLTTTGPLRLRAAAAAVLCLALAALAWPGLPSDVPAAIALALIPVVLVWTVGTASVRVRETS